MIPFCCVYDRQHALGVALWQKLHRQRALDARQRAAHAGERPAHDCQRELDAEKRGAFAHYEDRTLASVSPRL